MGLIDQLQQSDGDTLSLDFKASAFSDLPPGKHSFAITAKGSEVGSKQLIYDPNERSRSTSAELVEVYVDQMARLCRYICNNGLMTAEVDNILAEIFDETASPAIPIRVFEEFFGTNVIRRNGKLRT